MTFVRLRLRLRLHLFLHLLPPLLLPLHLLLLLSPPHCQFPAFPTLAHLNP
ncbi:MAG: hypothetical protein ACO1NQ_07575 [Flavobacteriales bacterium]